MPRVVCIHPLTKRIYHIQSLNKGCMKLTVCELCGDIIKKEYDPIDMSWIETYVNNLNERS